MSAISQQDSDEWFKMQAEKREEIARIIGGRQAVLPQYIANQIKPFLSDRFFYFRIPHGDLVWFEAWCNNDGVIASVRESAQELARRGCDVMLLPTEMSIRARGERRPVLVRPSNSGIDLQQIADSLQSAGFKGVYAPFAKAA
jgi:hypothetical protein